MEQRIEQLEKQMARIEARMASHWALQTDEEFIRRHMEGIRNELQSSMGKIVVTAILVLAGSGLIFVRYAVTETFSDENARLIAELESSYKQQVEQANANSESRKSHFFGKVYIYLAEILGKKYLTEVEEADLLTRAENHFKEALKYGNEHSSTYWELGELKYHIPLGMGLTSRVDRSQAIRSYIDAVNRYTEVEISRGWRAGAYYRIGEANFSLMEETAVDSVGKVYSQEAKKYLELASNEYSILPDQTSERVRESIAGINLLLRRLHTSAVSNK